jgi:hypothetical protein
MAKTSGIGWTTLSVDDSAGSVEVIKNDVTNLSLGTPRAVWDVTGVDKSAVERILLLADMSVTLNVVFNPASTPSSHDVFSTVPSSSVARTTTLTVAAKTLAAEILYTDYPLARSNSGELTAAVPGVLANGAVPTWA